MIDVPISETCQSFQIVLNQSGNYCIVRVYETKEEMHQDYLKMKPEDPDHFDVSGVHLAYSKIQSDETESKETGTILMNQEECDPSIVYHELLHAILWAHNHTIGKIQYPIIINSMDEEEILLYNFTHAVRQLNEQVQFY